MLEARSRQPDISHLASSVGRSLRRAVAELDSVTDAPRLEAEVLLAHVLQASRTTLLTHPERSLTSHQLSNYQTLIRRRVSDYPLPYLTGRVEFCGLEFEVTPEVLIPRPETETLVDLALARRPVTVVDVGTGCGCVAVSLAVRLPKATVFAIEISPAALAVAQRNVERHAVADRVRLMVADVLAPRPEPGGPDRLQPPLRSHGRVCFAAGLGAQSRASAGARRRPRWYGGRPAIVGPVPGGAAGRRGDVDRDRRGPGRAGEPPGSHLFPQAAVRLHPDLAGRDRVLEIQT